MMWNLFNIYSIIAILISIIAVSTFIVSGQLEILGDEQEGVINLQTPTATSTFNNDTANVNNSQYLQGFTPADFWQSSNSQTGLTGNKAGSASFNFSNFIQAATFISTIATGTAPFEVISTTKVTNLNVDRVDGVSVGTSGSSIPNMASNNNWNGVQNFLNDINTTNITTNQIIFRNSTESPKYKFFFNESTGGMQLRSV